MSVILVGCDSGKRMTAKLGKLQFKHPIVFAEYCSNMYPDTDSTGIEYVYMEGEVIYDTITHNTTTAMLDTIVVTQTKTIFKTRIDTIQHIQYRRVIDRAGIEACMSKFNKCVAQEAVLRREKSILLTVTLTMAIYTLARWILLAWKIRLP